HRPVQTLNASYELLMIVALSLFLKRL
ncbi:hypothetical protein LCGC14_3068250, partial [marine sediment metagenome]